jgi:hypothetical protein
LTDSKKTNEYVLVPSEIFFNQFNKLSIKSQKILEEKLLLLKINPHRNKRIHGFNLFLFRIRFEDERREKRVIYLLDPPNVKLLCILDRKNNYSDLKLYLNKLNFL